MQGRTAIMLVVDQKLVAIGKFSKQGSTAVLLAVDQKLVAIGKLSKQLCLQWTKSLLQ